MNFDLVDRQGTLIQATSFNETAMMHFDQLQEGDVYTVCNCQIKMSNKRYTSITHDYCLMFDIGTLIER